MRSLLYGDAYMQFQKFIICIKQLPLPYTVFCIAELRVIICIVPSFS